MGQAFRRAAGRIRSSSVDTTPPPPASHLKKSVDRTSPAVPVDNLTGNNVPAASENDEPKGADNVIEEKDSQYDVMLSQMVGRIRSQPGGKLEIGEATVVDKYNRPLPKLRNTKTESAKYEETPVPLGTLNVAQLRQIILLHQGKADDHNGPMDVHQIAVKFRVDAQEVEKILQYTSLPPEPINKQKNDQ